MMEPEKSLPINAEYDCSADSKEKKFIELLTKAESGDAAAQCELGKNYRYGSHGFYGITLQRNPEKAMYWYHKAASQGDADAMLKIGDILQEVYDNAADASLWHIKGYELQAKEDGDYRDDVTQADGFVYYIKRKRAIDTDGLIYKSNKDGSEPVKICGDEASWLRIAGGWIYCLNWSDGGALYKMNLSGGDKTKIMEDLFTDLVIDGDWIYYNNNDYDAGAEKLWKIRTDGSGKKNFNKSECDDPALKKRKFKTVMVREIQSASDGWVYYTERLVEPEINYFDGVSPHSTYHCKIRTDGTDKRVIKEVQPRPAERDDY
jgi:hypothetical protein